MITSSEKQSDKEVETSFYHLMLMPDLHVCHRGIAEVKISLPSPSLARPRTAPGTKHLQVVFLRHYGEDGAGGLWLSHFWGPNVIKIQFKQKIYDLTPPPPHFQTRSVGLVPSKVQLLCGRTRKMRF